MMGKPTIAGTRITVELILEKLAAGETPEEILSAHPRLTPKQVKQVCEVILKYRLGGQDDAAL